MPKTPVNVANSQIDKFRDAARELGTDDDPERFAERVRKLAKSPPSPQGSAVKPAKPPKTR